MRRNDNRVPSFEFGITLDYDFMEPVPFTELTKHGISSKRINTTNNKRFPEVFEFLEECEQKEKTNTEDSLEGNKSVTGGNHSQDNGHDVVKKYGAIDPKTYEVVIKAHYRSPKVAEDARKRANGICQLCGQPAPFNDASGRPYLEVHHVKWLSRGGSDTYDNVVALCPNCHSRMHVLDDSEDVEVLETVINIQTGN